MKIVLNEKTYICPPAKAKHFRKALVITKQHDLENITPETLDELVGFVCDCFGNQFSIDDIYEELESEALIPLVSETIQHVVGGADDKKK
jgi:hypothetical protein